MCSIIGRLTVTKYDGNMRKINNESIRECLPDWEDMISNQMMNALTKIGRDWCRVYRSSCKRFSLCVVEGSNLNDPDTGRGWKLTIDNSRNESLGTISVEYIEQVIQLMDMYKDY